MNIIEVTPIGFCSGAKKLDEKVFSAVKKNKQLFALGELIHNDRYMEKLRQQTGILEIKNLSRVKKGTIIIRAHGEAPRIWLEIKNKKLSLIDCVCPRVKKLQNLAKKLEKEGKQVVIFGKPNHPEVVGVQGFAPSIVVVHDESKINKIKKLEKIVLISQTTMEFDNFAELTKTFLKRFKNFELYNTICPEVQLRQEKAKKIAKNVETMIVIGGGQSSNTKSLTNICSKIVETHQVNSVKELDKKWFNKKENVGIATGCSTPDFVISEITEAMQKIKRT